MLIISEYTSLFSTSGNFIRKAMYFMYFPHKSKKQSVVCNVSPCLTHNLLPQQEGIPI